MSTNTNIYTGFWTNWSKGAILGSTLTLSERNGLILIAALAIFLQFAGAGSWSILCFITHQLRTTTQAKDGLHHQQQATLRNNASDMHSVWEFARIGWAWRSQAPGFRKSIALIVIGTLHIIAFGALSILSSHITTVGNEVLIAQSPACGPWGWLAGDSPPNTSTQAEESFVAHPSYLKMSTTASQQYVQNCLTGSESLPECTTYKSPQLNWTSANVPCQFGGLCLGVVNNNSIYMDTGLLDSRDDLGFNGPDTDRIQFRRNATCAPIETEGYMTTGNSSVIYTDNYAAEPNGSVPLGESFFNYTAAFYGPMYNPDFVGSGITDPGLSNATYIYTNFIDTATQLWSMEKSPYDIHAILSDLDNLYFTPLPEFSASNKTLSLIFASYSSFYEEPCDDPWLPAHRSTVVTEINANAGPGNNYSLQIFFPDKRLSALACTEQFQICNPSPLPNITSTCTPWLSSDALTDDDELVASVLSNDRQVAIATAIRIASQDINFYYTAFNLDPPLLADTFASADGSLPPAPNQWVLEVGNWFTINLVNTQRVLMDFITGPPGQFAKFARSGFTTGNPGRNWLCQNLIIRRNDFTNFSTLAISLVFGLGGLLIIVSMCLETVVGWFRMKWRSSRWRQRAWWAEGTLQLQRRAFEEMGIGEWEFDEWDRVPITSKGQIWNAFKNWDDMLPRAGGRRISTKQSNSQASPLITQGIGIDGGSAVLDTSPGNEKRKDLKRMRSNSI